MEPQKKGKKIKGFKNWLLARDAASRISSFPNYFATLESSESNQMDRKVLMGKFDTISETPYFHKLNKFWNFGMSKDSNSNSMSITFWASDQMRNIKILIESLRPTIFKHIHRIDISGDTSSDGFSIENAGQTGIKAVFPYSASEQELKNFAWEIIEKFISEINLGEEYKSEFFKWWLTTSLKKGSKFEFFPSSFESALVEWMKIAHKNDASQAYLDLVNNANDEKAKRIYTDLGNKEVIDHVNWGIKEFKIDLEDIKKGSSIISRFGI